MGAMEDPGPDIPRLERLMRDVLRDVCAQQIGPDWLDQISRTDIDRAGDMARKNRPDEVLRDNWDAVGLSEIRGVLKGRWEKLAPRLAPAWARREAADVDLQRLLDYRGKSLHAVGITNASSLQAETSGIITRLRLAFEAIRRSFLPEATNWIPYLEAIESPIRGLCWSRDQGQSEQPTLHEGDLVEVRLVGVNPAGAQSDLRYRIEVTGIAGGGIVLPPPSGGPYPQQQSNEFAFEVPRTREITINGYVSADGDPDMYDGNVVVARVIPRRPGGT